MPAAHVQDAALGSTSSGTSQQTLAFGSNPTVGNYLVAWCWGWAGGGTNTVTAITFSDTGGNSWSVPSGAFQNQANDVYVAVGYAQVATSGATFKVTATRVGTTTIASIMVCAAEFSGIPLSSPLDGTAAGATGTGVTVAPGSKSIASGSLVVEVQSDDNTSFLGSTPSGFTRVGFQNNGSTFQAGEGAYAINPTSPTNPSRTITSAKWVAAQFALLAAGGQDTPELYGPRGQRLMQQLLVRKHDQPGYVVPGRKWYQTGGGVIVPENKVLCA